MGDSGRDAALLLDMLSYAEEAHAIVAGHRYEAFMKDRLRVLALERTLEVVGEAARNVTQARKDALAEIPWRLINGQRNAIAHQYGKIDHFQLFRTAGEDLPGLVAVLKRILDRP